MPIPELAQKRHGAGRSLGPPEPAWAGVAIGAGGALIVALTAIGLILRLIVAHQSLFADELSTYWIVADHGLRGVLDLLYSRGPIQHAEITPPLYFVAAWFTTRLGHAPELLRLPSLIAGTLTIPTIYLLGLRTVGRKAAILASALVTLSPFMIYYSSEARAYGVLMLLVILSTLSMLRAIDTGRRWWWVAYAACSSAALYTHYTCAFVLAAQFAWIWWAHHSARKPAVLANVGVLVALLPWSPGLLADIRSPTVRLLSALSPFDPHSVRIVLGHWALGFPYTTLKLSQLPGLPALVFPRLTQVPGVPALVLITVGLVFACFSIASNRAAGGDPTPHDRRRLVLVLLLVSATPVAEGLVSVVGTHLFGERNLAASWPALALAFAALLVAGSGRLRVVGVGCAVLALALAAVGMVNGRWGRPDYGSAVAFVTRNAGPSAVVLDETGYVSPGPLTALDVALKRPLRVVRALAPAEHDHPFTIFDRFVPLAQAVREAIATADGAPIFVVGGFAGRSSLVPRTGTPYADYQRVAVHTYVDIRVAEYARVGG